MMWKVKLLMKKQKKMFDCITKTWNPLGGVCPHNCVYCWAKKLAERRKLTKYTGKYRLIEKELHRKFNKDDFVFVCDMLDLFAHNVPAQYIIKILNIIEQHSDATFLLLTKNPARYMEFNIPPNCICGTTIETDLYPNRVSHALPPLVRVWALRQLKHPRKMVSIEPIMRFTPAFSLLIASIRPEFVYIGRDNYGNNLIEPTREELDVLIDELSCCTEVRLK